MSDTLHPSLADRIARLTGQHPFLCYQCGKCSAGCPVRAFTELAPNRVVRLVQLGFDKEALQAPSAWLCAGCMTCTTRCPKGFDLAGFMDCVRQIGRQENVPLPEKKIRRFHEAFLRQVERFGRAFELGLVAEYKMASGDLMQDVDMAPAMVLKGKLGFFPHRVNNPAAIRRLFQRVAEAERK
ncbi:MAG: 4Fe-4S dicluster domain-containing protein [Bacteroidota bacterium]|nr:4Fe-4S dicluster domain-containing protein [Bacteroidota bacterium]